MSLSPDYQDKLLDALLDVPAFNDPLAGPTNRGMLLHRLPRGPVAAVPRYPAPMSDLNSIVTAAAGMGQLLDSGEWALAIVTRNALRFARGIEPGKLLTELLAELETAATPQPWHLSPRSSSARMSGSPSASWSGGSRSRDPSPRSS